MKIRKPALFFSAIFAASAVFAEIVMPRIFSDNMMFQRDMPLKIWGKADAGARVGVEFKDQKKMVKASGDGSWSIELAPVKGSFDPAELVVFENGKEGKRIKNVLVGEVWVLGGQSNMEWRLIPTTDGEAAKARAKYPALRYFTQPSGTFTPEKQFDTPESSKWQEASPDTVARWSGVGFYFGEQLMKDLEVPVGLIETPLGGSAMRAWIPDEAVSGIPFLEENLANFKKQLAAYDYNKALAEWKKRSDAYEASVKAAKAEGKPVPEKPWNVRNKPNKLSPQRPQETPGWLYNAKIAPIAGFAARGFLWYQGESDAGGKSLECFEEQFARIIETWRKAWNNDDMYFFWVQLASFGGSGDWATARWKQYQTMRSVQKTGMANIIDLGEEKDIHPRNKTDVGLRLEKIALRDVYGVKGLYPYGPMFKMVRYTPKGAEVVYDLDGRKLVGKGDPRGFEVKIAGEWKPAKAELVGKRVIVNPADAEKGAKIEGVRYLWKKWALPDVWLFNDQGLPALSFIAEK